MKIGIFYSGIKENFNENQASTWIRILQMIPEYEKLGCKVDINNYINTYDVCILFKRPKKKYFFIIQYLKLISKKTFLDTCIDIFDTNKEINNKKLKYAIKIAKSVDGIICASDKIAEFSKNYTPETYVLDDPINLNHFKYTKKEINYENPTFGWSGTSSKSVILNKYSKHINKKIHLICESNVFERNLNFHFTHKEWEYENFPVELLKCDIAFLPRDISEKYNQGHSSFKALVYAIQGIPIIANKIPSYEKLNKYYDSIVFLEDYEDNLDKCINELKNRSRDTRELQSFYSCPNQAKKHISFLKETLNN